MSSALRKNQIEVLSTSRRIQTQLIHLDLLDDPSLWPELPYSRTIVICAAMNNLDQCEKNPELSYKINVQAVKTIISKYQSDDSQLIFFSSSRVFSGEKQFYETHEPVSPKCVYGKHKAMAEKLIGEKNGLVIRLSKVVGPNFQRFKNWADHLQQEKPIQCREDLNTSLISIAEVINLSQHCIANNIRGIVHYSGPEDKSYFEIGCTIADLLGFEELVLRDRLSNCIEDATPGNSTLQNSNFISDINIQSPTTREYYRNG